MSKRTIQEPVCNEEEGPLHDKVYTHPSYGQISASRVSGHTHLYDSDFHHQHYVTIHIRKSELHRGLSRDWHFGREEIVEVSLSEAQWASFVSSMNVGMGVPCTIQHILQNETPYLPAPASRSEQFAGEAAERLEKVMKALKEIEATIDSNTPMNKGKVKELKDKLLQAKQNLGVNLKFVADSFGEHMEETVEKAKIEVNAYVTATINRAGLEAIAAGKKVITFGPSKVKQIEDVNVKE